MAGVTLIPIPRFLPNDPLRASFPPVRVTAAVHHGDDNDGVGFNPVINTEWKGVSTRALCFCEQLDI
jgi:hypothetical protein